MNQSINRSLGHARSHDNAINQSINHLFNATQSINQSIKDSRDIKSGINCANSSWNSWPKKLNIHRESSKLFSNKQSGKNAVSVPPTFLHYNSTITVKHNSAVIPGWKKTLGTIASEKNLEESASDDAQLCLCSPYRRAAWLVPPSAAYNHSAALSRRQGPSGRSFPPSLGRGEGR